jgi:Putative Flp pilus-assembly TadE/G-like
MITFSITKQLRRLRADERGTVAIIMGVLIIPLVGALGIGFEVSNWYMITRGMQNAADAAAIAAAANGGSNYDVEAKAVAARYGFVHGTNNISIVVSCSSSSNPAPAPSCTTPAACPAGGNTCYSVTISGFTPLLLSQVVGFKGDTNLNGTLEKKLISAAVANASTPQNICMLALASSGAAQGIRTNGAPTADMNGCNVMSNTAAQCNGSNLNAGFGLAHGTSNGCGVTPVSNVPVVTDPYANRASLIPPLSSSGCAGNYPQETTHGNAVNPPSTRVPGALTLNPNLLTGVPVTSLPLSGGNNFMCGDQVLTADVVITTSAPSVLIIENGQLDLNGHTLSSSGSGLTLVFSGDNPSGPHAPSYTHAPTDNTNGNTGVLDITAPALANPPTPSWSGVAIYQDPSLTSGLDVSAAGNSPTWKVSGLVYMPHASVTLKGAIDKGTAGKSCLVLVADNFTISGTAGILKTDIGQCGQAGLTMPGALAGRVALVL